MGNIWTFGVDEISKWASSSHHQTGLYRYIYNQTSIHHHQRNNTPTTLCAPCKNRSDKELQWNACVEFLPLWLAPNMVTLLGFFCILSNVALLVIYEPTMDGTDPSWLYYSFALGLWAYSTMDNIDGKQASRTGTSSPLCE